MYLGPEGGSYQGISKSLTVTVYDNECGAWGYHGGDADRNCEVNIGDVAALSQEWLMCSRPEDPECINLLLP